jgi:hypothetical protein
VTLDLSLDNRITLDSVIDCAIQELDMLFNTTNTELIGDPEYGTNFEQFLWQISPSPNSLTNYIYQKIDTTYFASQLDITVNVSVETGVARDIYCVEINLPMPDSVAESDKKKYRRVYMLR